ncbi:Eukaryotic translation initiation factor 2 subunit 2 [Thelohanellus kitauei]|uniref:Eukaryotic translation initiation factor 2 subunit 2 n=1 Tax=Thelohanellus kitauei TaxID=669202 RepID=A0A0C2IUQ9_THEKT|nr:Eukaryotic translation initiation factor 2 subunit 2 [Thelohanellus kitauei]
MLEIDPEVLSVRKKYATRPPELQRVGTKRIRFMNFIEICNVFKRPSSHLMDFILVELGTTGSLDSKEALTVKGRYEIKQFEAILRKYIKEYVLCPNCKSSETKLVKEQRLSFIICDKCNSKRSVSNIKSGMQGSQNK